MKKTIGLIFGGRSAEHEVSIKSAKSVYNNIDKQKFNIVLIYINKGGLWSVQRSNSFETFNEENSFSFLPWELTRNMNIDCDIYFPVLHGPNGEDGKVQSLIELSNKPLVGANSLGSALAMDKTIAKKMFQDTGLNIIKSLSFSKTSPLKIIVSEVKNMLEVPVFIKPNSMGSSVGISKAITESEIIKGIENAFKYDNRIIIEEGLNVREIEVSVIGNEKLMVSRPGELIPDSEFYDYEDKYIKGKTKFDIPAKLDRSMELKIIEQAEKAYKSLYLNGMARVDFFIEKETDKIFVNEINTIPGFTEISMFPKLWEIDGLCFKDLLEKLINYGFDHYENTGN